MAKKPLFFVKSNLMYSNFILKIKIYEIRFKTTKEAKLHWLQFLILHI